MVTDSIESQWRNSDVEKVILYHWAVVELSQTRIIDDVSDHPEYTSRGRVAVVFINR